MKIRNRLMSAGVVAVLVAATALSFATASPASAATSQKINYDMVEIGAQFKLPWKLMDLGYKTVYIKGDQDVTTVEFTTKRLQDAGCTIDMAPMGMLTYHSDLGGTKVGKVRGSNMYYIKPDGRCHAKPSLQQWKLLRTALQDTLKADS